MSGGEWVILLGDLRMLKKPLVSVIIVNWNGGDVMLQCLESLIKVDYSNWELIVVDNGSTDGSENTAANLKFTRSTNSRRAISNF